MKKIKLGLGVVLGLIALYVGATWIVGVRAQSMLTHAVDQVNERIAQALRGKISGDARLEITEYRRGVFSSSVRYVLHIPGVDDAPVVLQDTLEHGPWPWTRVRSGDLSPLLLHSETRLLPTAFTQPWFDAAQDQPLQARTRVGLSLDTRSELRLAPVVFKQDDFDLQFGGGQIMLNFANRFTRSDGGGSFAAFHYADARDSLQIRDITLSSQSQQRDGEMRSHNQLNAATVTWMLYDAQALKVENFGIETLATQLDALMDLNLRYRLGKVTLQDRDLGAFDLGLSAKRMNVVAARTLASLLERMQQDAYESDEDEDNDFDTLQKQVHALLEPEPALAVDHFAWTTAQGESRMALTLDFFAAQQDGEISFEDMGLQYVRQANLTLDLSRTMALHVVDLMADDKPMMPGMFAALLDRYAQQLQSAGWIRIDGDRLSLQASYRGEDESVELNGARISLQEFAVNVMRLLNAF